VTASLGLTAMNVNATTFAVMSAASRNFGSTSFTAHLLDG
jgi:hypothetical protein